MAPEILNASSISSPDSSVLPVVRREGNIVQAATACTPTVKDFPTSWTVILSFVLGNVGFLDDGQKLEPGTRYTARTSSSLVCSPSILVNGANAFISALAVKGNSHAPSADLVSKGMAGANGTAARLGLD